MLNKDGWQLLRTAGFKIIFLLGCCMSASYGGQAQEVPAFDGMGIETNLMVGKILVHTPKFTSPVPDATTVFDLNVVRQTDGRKSWQQRRHYPVTGVGFTYTNYGIDSIYGRCWSLYLNLQVPIISYKKFEWTIRGGLGLGYVTRKYERLPVWDTLNKAIGSHINGFALASTDLRYRLNAHWDIQLGAQFTHISNAAFRQPNLGINTYGVHVGIRYFPTTAHPSKIEQLLPVLRNRWLLQARLGLAFKETGYTDGPLYPVYLATMYASKRYAGRNKFFAGVDYSYHDGIYAFLRNNEIYPGTEKAHSWKGAVFVGNEFLLGKLGFLLQVGGYFKQAYLKQDAVYEKLGLVFYIVQSEQGLWKELAVSTLLKTHQTQAELVEMGIGVGF
jgi:hypothetical protein